MSPRGPSTYLPHRLCFIVRLKLMSQSICAQDEKIFETNPDDLEAISGLIG